MSETEKTVQKLINGETAIILTENEREATRKRLEEIKKRCTIVLSQLNDKTSK